MNVPPITPPLPPPPLFIHEHIHNQWIAIHKFLMLYIFFFHVIIILLLLCVSSVLQIIFKLLVFVISAVLISSFYDLFFFFLEDHLLVTIVNVMYDSNVFTGEHFPTIVIRYTLFFDNYEKVFTLYIYF